jgi:uncharacterized protein (DUF169 family)
MNERQFLEKLTGQRWTGVRFLELPLPDAKPFARLCEAVRCSFRNDLTVACGALECLGALRSVGLGRHDEQMARQISEKTGMSLERAQGLLAATPILTRSFKTIQLGATDHPDVLMAYLRPEAAMKLLRRWQQTTGQRLATELSAFTAVCASLVAAYQEGQLVFSFGCPDSREYGGIGPDRLVAALPRGVVSQMMQEVEDHANV